MRKPFKLACLADTHYYSPTLGTSGKAYALRSGSDQKCLAETGYILDEAFRQIVDSGADAVLIAGDLTDNGETASHTELREKLCALQKHLPVYVLTATHDWCCDENARRYEGDGVFHDVDTLPADALSAFYRQFGLCDAIATYKTHIGALSYVVQPCEGLRILMLNDDQNGRGHSGFTEEHLQWIERQITNARRAGCQVIAAEHHPIIPPVHPFLTGGNSAGDREEIVERLSAAGLRCVITGHLHMQDVVRHGTLTEVSLGTICGWPGNIVYATLDDTQISLQTEAVSCRELLKKQTLGVLQNLLDGAVDSPEAFRERLHALHLPTKLSIARPYIRLWAKRMDTLTVREAYHLLRRRLPGLLPAVSLDVIGNDPLGDTVKTVFLSLFGDGLAKTPDDDLYKVVTTLFAIPQKLLRHNEVCRKIAESGVHLMQKKPLDGIVIQSVL